MDRFNNSLAVILHNGFKIVVKSEKATKFCEVSTVNLIVTTQDKSRFRLSPGPLVPSPLLRSHAPFEVIASLCKVVYNCIFVLCIICLSAQQYWKVKLESAYSFMLKYSLITVCCQKQPEGSFTFILIGAMEFND